jgi:hypothetical protein
VSVTLGVLNVCALDRWARPQGLATPFSRRADDIAAVCKQHGVDLMLVQELVTYANAKLLSKHMGWGGQMTDPDELDPKKGDSCILKGEGGVAMGLIWNPDKVQFYQLGLTNTYPGWARNRYSLNGRAFVEGKRCGFASVHFEFMPKGPNNQPYYDNIRYKQMDGLLEQVKRPRQSWIVAGDYNHARNDRPDTPASAATKHGVKQHIDAGNIIRGMATTDIKLHGAAKMIPLRGASDHPMLLQEFSVPV